MLYSSTAAESAATVAHCLFRTGPLQQLPVRTLPVLPRLVVSTALHAPPGTFHRDARKARAQRLKSFATIDLAITEVEAQPTAQPDGSKTVFPSAAGVYAIYDKDGKLQYIGISRRVALSVANHLEELPELTSAVKVGLVADPTKENLTAAWKEWVQQAVSETGQIPPGNAPGEKLWTTRKSGASRPEIRLTPGKGLADLTCSITDLVDQVVKTNKVVAFVKGSRNAPQCGFSYKVLNLLNESGADYQVVNVLDEVYNPGLREGIKQYSQWPTIPQVFINGEFVGGADILEEMFNSGELKQMLQQK